MVSWAQRYNKPLKQTSILGEINWYQMVFRPYRDGHGFSKSRYAWQ